MGVTGMDGRGGGEGMAGGVGGGEGVRGRVGRGVSLREGVGWEVGEGAEEGLPGGGGEAPPVGEIESVRVGVEPVRGEGVGVDVLRGVGVPACSNAAPPLEEGVGGGVGERVAVDAAVALADEEEAGEAVGAGGVGEEEGVAPLLALPGPNRAAVEDAVVVGELSVPLELEVGERVRGEESVEVGEGLAVLREEGEAAAGGEGEGVREGSASEGVPEVEGEAEAVGVPAIPPLPGVAVG